MRPEKKSIIDEYSSKLKDKHFVMLADYRGMTVEQLTELRKLLHTVGSGATVVKNGLFQIALNELGWDKMPGTQDGPTAVISGTGEITDVAKALKDFIKKHNDLPVMKGGKLNGTFLTVADIEAIAQIPSREILLGRLVGTIAAPISQTVGVLKQKVASLVYVLKAVEEKKSN